MNYPKRFANTHSLTDLNYYGYIDNAGQVYGEANKKLCTEELKEIQRQIEEEELKKKIKRHPKAKIVVKATSSNPDIVSPGASAVGDAVATAVIDRTLSAAGIELDIAHSWGVASKEQVVQLPSVWDFSGIDLSGDALLPFIDIFQMNRRLVKLILKDTKLDDDSISFSGT